MFAKNQENITIIKSGFNYFKTRLLGSKSLKQLANREYKLVEYRLQSL